MSWPPHTLRVKLRTPIITGKPLFLLANSLAHSRLLKIGLLIPKGCHHYSISVYNYS